MLVAPRFDAAFREQELRRGQKSLWYFSVAILGFNAPGPSGESQAGELQHELCHFLEGRKPFRPWRRALVCEFRGAGKSIFTTEAYPMWRGLYIPNFSTKIIENSSDNAKFNHFLKIVDLFTTSERADYLQWLYEHRIPSGFDGWTTERIKLIQTDPNAAPCLSYFGIESKIEGAHVRLVVLDDAEGADAQKSKAANEEAWQAYQKAVPLLKYPTQDQILVVGTPHGKRPFVYRIRDRENWQGEADNKRTVFQILWRPVLNSRGESAWPERFPMAAINALRVEDTFPQQFMLEREASTFQLFNMRDILGNPAEDDEGTCYRWLDNSVKDAVVYPGFDYDPKRWGTDPAYVPPPVMPRIASLREMRFYIHVDPKHKSLEFRRSPANKQRPADAASLVVGVTPDFHVLVMDYWHEDAELDRQAVELFRLYRTWCPALATFEATGAQWWLKGYVENYEKMHPLWRRPTSLGRLGPQIDLPRLSSRLVPSENDMVASKEWLFREVLSPWWNRGILHLRRDQVALIGQLTNVMNEDWKCDLVDCLTQGPKVWAPPLPSDAFSRRFHEHVARVNQKLAQGAAVATGWMQRTGYRAPWG